MPDLGSDEVARLVVEITDLCSDSATAYRVAHLADAAAGQRLIELRRTLGRVGWARWMASRGRDERIAYGRAMRAAGSL